MNDIATASKRTRTYASYLQQQREERAQGKQPSREGLLGTVITWEMLERVKTRSGLPLILKGVTTADDARLAIEHGVDVIYISNHGGRAIDHGRGTIQVLPQIVDAIEGKAEIIIDGGFVRGSDVLKAISLGANAVCMGRMQSWALAAGGQAGLVRMLEILEEEIIVTMGLLGVTRLDQLTSSYLEPTQPVVLPHPLSAFPVVMERLARE
jgi:isopentenyl diphosphate isomerase/L-lactate dehydrogenase-like FMN-dependent dehydrogenase